MTSGPSAPQGVDTRLIALAYLLLCGTAVFWSGNAIAGRLASGAVPPITLAFCRWALACLFLLPFAARAVMRDWPVIRKNWPVIIGLSFAGIGCFNTFLYLGLQTTSAVNAGLLQAAMPLIIVIFTVLGFRETPTRWQVAGLALGFTGVAAIILRGDVSHLATFRFNGGDLWCLLGVLCYAAYTAFLRLRPAMGQISFIFISFALGASMLAPFAAGELYLGGADMLSGAVAAEPASVAALILYVGIFPSIGAYFFFNRAVDVLGANRAGVSLYLVPLFTSVLAVFLLNEPFRLYHLAGLALIFAGLGISARRSAVREA